MAKRGPKVPGLTPAKEAEIADMARRGLPAEFISQRTGVSKRTCSRRAAAVVGSKMLRGSNPAKRPPVAPRPVSRDTARQAKPITRDDVEAMLDAADDAADPQLASAAHVASLRLADPLIALRLDRGNGLVDSLIGSGFAGIDVLDVLMAFSQPTDVAELAALVTSKARYFVSGTASDAVLAQDNASAAALLEGALKIIKARSPRAKEKS